MRRSYFCLILLLTICLSINAQENDSIRVTKDSLLNKITNIDARLKEISIKDVNRGFSAPLVVDTAYLNSILENNMHPLRDENGLLLFSHEWTPFDDNLTFADTIIFEPAFLPIVFDGKILSPELILHKRDSSRRGEPFHLVSPDSTFAPLLKKARHIEYMRRLYYTENPLKVKLNALDFKDSPVIVQNVVEKKNPFKELITADSSIGIVAPDIEKTKIKTVNWIFKGSHKIDLTQQSYSEYWPGENNFFLLSYQKIDLNYRKKKVYWNNLIEWRVSFQHMKHKEGEGEEAKEEYKIKISDDYLRTYSVFGVDAFKNWSYTSSLEMRTPLFNKFNGDTRQRAFLSPFESNVGIGMSYGKEIKSQADKYRLFRININLQILSLNYKNVVNGEVNPGQHGIEAEHTSRLDYGSTYNLNLTYNRNRYTNFTSRIHYFTNYERAYVEWENTLNFKLNQYFTTSLYFYMKFDDSAGGREGDRWDKYFSHNQRIGLGLTYNW